MNNFFEKELINLRVLFSEMGKMVNETIYKSVKAFINHDKAMAKEVVNFDPVINQLEARIEKKSFELIALHQPVTGDLRRIVTIMQASADMERMGDHAVSISKSTIRVNDNKRVPEIEAMIAEQSEKVKIMVERILIAYIQNDRAAAWEISQSNLEIQTISNQIYDQSIEEMKKDPELVSGVTDYIFVTGYLSRIGDYGTNICEWISYQQTGKLVEWNTHNTLNDVFP